MLWWDVRNPGVPLTSVKFHSEPGTSCYEQSTCYKPLSTLFFFPNWSRHNKFHLLVTVLSISIDGSCKGGISGAADEKIEIFTLDHSMVILLICFLHLLWRLLILQHLVAQRSLKPIIHKYLWVEYELVIIYNHLCQKKRPWYAVSLFAVFLLCRSFLWKPKSSIRVVLWKYCSTITLTYRS